MRTLAFSLILLLAISSATAYEDILVPINSGRSYNRYSLIQSLHSNLPTQTKTSKAMDLDIVCDFIRRYFNHEEVSVEQILTKFKSLFSRYHNEWIDDMVSKTMRAIGIDMENDELVQKIRRDPKSYSIDYETYKIVTFRQ